MQPRQRVPPNSAKCIRCVMIVSALTTVVYDLQRVRNGREALASRRTYAVC